LKKFLPDSIDFSIKNIQGFTLIELLIVISLIAILSTISIAIYSGVQSNARDAARRSDIQSISKALEIGKDTSSNTYKPLTNDQFSSGGVPVGPTNTTARYCIIYGSNNIVPQTPTWTTDICPVASSLDNGSTTVTQITMNQRVFPPPNATTNYLICALLENGTSNIYCISSQQ